MLKSAGPPETSLLTATTETASHLRDQPWARSAAGYEMTRRLALAGVIGPPLFVIAFLVLGFIKTGYDPVTQFVSEGSIGELGWIQIADFLACGAAMLAFSLGLWLGFGDRLSGRIGSALIGVAGVGFLGSGVFVTDPYPQIVTTHGALHVVMGLITFNAVALACFFFAKRLWSERPFAVWSITTGVLFHPGFPPLNVIGNHGLVQRILIIVGLTWLTFLALRLWRSSSPHRVDTAARA